MTRATLPAYLRLEVRADQQGLVAPNPITIAQCPYEPGGHVWGLEAAGTPVGLMAMIDMEAPGVAHDPSAPKNCACLWRLMISASHQGKGYGRSAIAQAFGVARDWGRTRLAVQVVDVPESAAPLYVKMGFVATEVMFDDERLFLADVAR